MDFVTSINNKNGNFICIDCGWLLHMDDNLCREPNDDPALSHRQGSQVFQSKIPKNQAIKNKFWSDPLKKGKKLWSKPLKKKKKIMVRTD